MPARPAHIIQSKETKDPDIVSTQSVIPSATQDALQLTVVTNVMNENAEILNNARKDTKSSPSHSHSPPSPSIESPENDNENNHEDTLRILNEPSREDDHAEDSKGIGIFETSLQEHPCLNDIDTAKTTSNIESSVVVPPLRSSRPATPVKASRPTITVPSQPATPTAIASQTSASPAPRQVQPRTIRVVQAPKMEPPPRPPVTRTAAPAAASTTSKQLSRQPSLASIHQPGTPQNEIVSDNASLTSTSMSRPGSPPLTKVGSAPVRQTTKSQQKKERQARAKKVEESVKSEEPITEPTFEGPIQAPIIGRKKKAKKTIAAISTDSTSAGSGPPSPPVDEARANEARPKDDVVTGSTITTPVTPVKEAKKSKKAAKKSVKKDNSQSHATAQDIAENPEITLSEAADALQKTLLSAASIFENLLKSNEISANALDLFRQPPGLNHRHDLTDSDFTDAKIIPSLTEAQRNSLQQGVAISIETAHGKWAVILPDRRILRGYTKKEADRYLQLRAKIIAAEGPGVFNSTSRSMEQVLHSPTPQSMPPFTEGHNPATGSFTDQYSSEQFFNADDSSSAHRSGSLGGSNNYWTSVQGYRGGAANGGEEGGHHHKGTTMSVEEAEKALLETRKETEALEKRLAALVKKNKRLLVGSGH